MAIVWKEIGAMNNIIIPKVIGFSGSGSVGYVSFYVPDAVNQIKLEWTGKSESPNYNYIKNGQITIYGTNDSESKTIASDSKTPNNNESFSFEADVSQYTNVYVYLMVSMSEGPASAILQNIEMSF